MIRAKLTFQLNGNALLRAAENIMQQMDLHGYRPATISSLQQLHEALDAYRQAICNHTKSQAKAKVLQAVKQWYLQSSIAVQQSSRDTIIENPRTEIENGLPPTPLTLNGLPVAGCSFLGWCNKRSGNTALFFCTVLCLAASPTI
jgi:hypothetical protein